MCLKKVLYCPDCQKYQRLADIRIPIPPYTTMMVIYEHPCGRSTCARFQPLMVPRGEKLPDFDEAELGKPCPTGNCTNQSCRYEREVVSCCNEIASHTHYRSKSSWLL